VSHGPRVLGDTGASAGPTAGRIGSGAREFAQRVLKQRRVNRSEHTAVRRPEREGCPDWSVLVAAAEEELGRPWKALL